MGRAALPVIIRDEGGQVVAFFPTEPGNESDPRTMGGYSPRDGHIVAASNYVIRDTRPATAEQIATMLKELARLGYDEVRVIERASPHHHKIRRNACQR